MEDPQQAFAKAFRIPHLEGNSFLYGELPPSFKLNKQPFPSEKGPIRPINLPIDLTNKENTVNSPGTPPPPKLVEQGGTEEKLLALCDGSQRGDYVETQGSTGRESGNTQRNKGVKKGEKGECCDGKLIEECRKLIEDVKKMKRRRGHSSHAPRSTSPNPFHPPTPPPQHPPTPPLAVPQKASVPPTMPKLYLSDDCGDIKARKSVPVVGIEGVSLYKVTREYSESRKTGKKQEKTHGKRMSLGGLKSNVTYLQEVYSVIEAHAKHCKNLKSDLQKLRADYESSLFKHS